MNQSPLQQLFQLLAKRPQLLVLLAYPHCSWQSSSHQSSFHPNELTFHYFSLSSDDQDLSFALLDILFLYLNLL